MIKLDNKTMRKDVALKIKKLFDKIDVVIKHENDVSTDGNVRLAQQANNFLNLSVELFHTYMDYLYQVDEDLTGWRLGNDVYLFIDKLSNELTNSINCISKNIDLSTDDYNDNELRYWVKSYTNVTKFIKDIVPLTDKFSWEISQAKKLKELLDNSIDLQTELNNKRSLNDVIKLADNERKLIKCNPNLNINGMRLALINLAIDKNYTLITDLNSIKLKELRNEYTHLDVVSVYDDDISFKDNKTKYDFSKKYLIDYNVFHNSIPMDKLEIVTGFIKDTIND
jgi:hypothetical protein